MGAATPDEKFLMASTKLFQPCEWAANKCAPGDAVKCTPKRGQAMSTKVSPDQCLDMKLLGPNHWFYGWGKEPADTYKPGCARQHDSGFIPQMWGGKKASSWTDPVYVPADALLGFNEPDGKDQAKMTPQEAADAWPKLEARAAELGIQRIGSPCAKTASFNNGGNNALKWYDEFFSLCTDCKIDFLVVHSYKTKAPTAIQLFKDLYDRYQLRMWVKEFNAGGKWTGKPMKDHLTLMSELVPWMENSSFIERYAWMSTRNVKFTASTLIDSNTNALTDLGKKYRDLPMSVGK
eukprot:gnl/MRDRNA2_/MRDRNA2_71085_c0_seq1.p1 gnl/MRDRNA2_/MRDRNA2_71085_c0~~gnl/MRDRNA2_/MRDRNA2_71085_c0_seq1.p1  ORF type:complete len:292 (+),score=44.02 gnl/MRDRNA2_/MRDRNA2_71085_c0_seq1:35-910(+)